VDGERVLLDEGDLNKGIHGETAAPGWPRRVSSGANSGMPCEASVGAGYATSTTRRGPLDSRFRAGSEMAADFNEPYYPFRVSRRAPSRPDAVTGRGRQAERRSEWDGWTSVRGGDHMRQVRVSKNDLRAKLVENRERHRGVFEEALAGFQKEAVRLLEEQAERARRGLRRNVYVHLECPEDHTSDYDRIIAMLDMEVDDEVVLTEQEFAQFVQDNWSWQQQWLTSSSRFSAAARTHLAEIYGADDDAE
jgi:hypothetical protein